MKHYLYLFLILLSFGQLSLAQVPSNTLDIGDNTASNKKIRAKNGATNKPYLLWNQSSQKWQFSNDGLATKDLGSGGGGGGGVNLLTADDNAGFEDGATVWAASGGSFVATAVSPLYGLSSGVFDASALNQTLTSASRAVVEGLKGAPCLAAISYKYAGASGDYKIQATDGTNVLAEQSLNQTLSAADAFLGFTCPLSGSVNTRLIAAVANPGAITLDGASVNSGNVQLGSNVLLGTLVTGSSFFGSANYYGSSCIWSLSATGGSFNNYGTNSNCTSFNGLGELAAPTTTVPGFNATLKKGHYQINMSVLMTTTGGGGNVSCRISNGTVNSTIAYNGNRSADFGDSSSTSMMFDLNVTADQPLSTYQLQCNVAFSSHNIIADENNLRSLQFNVYKFGDSANNLIASTSTVAQTWSGYHDNTCSFDRANSSYGDFSSDASCALVQETNNNLGSVTSALSSGNPIPGIVFTPRKIGTYEVCASPTFNQSGTAQQNGFRLTDGSTVYWSTQLNGVSGGAVQSFERCRYVNATTVGPITLRIEGKGTSASNVNIGAGGDRAIEWTIKDVSQNFPQPIITSSPRSLLRLATTNGYGLTNTKRRRFAVVITNTGSDWSYVDSAADGATITINTPGVYSGTYCDMYNTVGGYNGIVLNNNQGTTNIQSVTQADRLVMTQSNSGGQPTCAPWTGFLNSGDVIAPHAEGASENANPQYNTFTFSKVAN